jgi:phage protein D
MARNTSTGPRYAPRFEVTLDGTVLAEPGERIADLVVETTLDGADRFQFTLTDRLDAGRDGFRDLSWDRFSVGTDVRIDAGYGSDRSLTPLFAGRIGSVTASFGHETGPAVEIAGYGLLAGLMDGTGCESWTGTTVGAVVKDVLSGSAFSTVEVRDADIKRERLLQHDQNDYRFLAALAEAYGFDFHGRRETVRFVPQGDGDAGGDPDTRLTYGDRLASVQIRQSPDTTHTEVRAWDPDSVSTTTATASAGDDGSGGAVSATSAATSGAAGGGTGDDDATTFVVPSMSRREAEAVADPAAERLAGVPATAVGRADGEPSVQAGATVELDGVGEHFGGRYRVTEATHRLGGDGYRTTFEAEEVSP